MGYQNFFATRLFTDIGAADTTITLENPPAVTSGRLVLEARNTSKREIISYTGVSGNDITGVTRGVGGTSATDHVKNSLVEMNVVAEDLEDALNVPNDIETRFNEVISDHVASGLVVTDDTGLTADISAGVAYINGIRLDVAADLNHAFTASKDTYVDLGDNGVLDYNEVANNATPPALAANHLRIAMVRTSATDTTVVSNTSNSSYLEKSDGWRKGLPAVSSVTYILNGGQTMTFASDVSGILQPGMRIRTTRSVRAPSQLPAFNGSTQYLVKTSPTGLLGSITNNITIMGWVLPTNYQDSILAARLDAAVANGFRFQLDGTGRLTFGYWNGAGNARIFSTYKAVNIFKRSHIALTFSSTGPAVKFYLNGEEIAGYQVSSTGTNPTTFGTGGDFALGRNGANSNFYWAGYFSDVNIYNAVLDINTIRNYMTYSPTGAEANCIGSWDLNNRLTDQSSVGNNLTAVGGPAFETGTPYGDKARTATLDYALVTAVSGSVVNVQVPEGCIIPVNGISEVAYSTEKTPYGWITDESRWAIYALFGMDLNTAGPVSNTWYSTGPIVQYLPVGTWDVEFWGSAQTIPTASGAIDLSIGLSKVLGAPTYEEIKTRRWIYHAVTTHHIVPVLLRHTLTVTTATPLYAVYAGAGSYTNVGYRTNGTGALGFKALPAGL
jgi:hypothetical protein